MTNRGLEYERNARNTMEFLGYSSGGLSGHDLILRGGYPCELKLKNASAGSLVIKYDKTWHFEDTSNPEKAYLRELANTVGLFEQIKSTWGDIAPFQRVRDAEWDETIGIIPTDYRYLRDKAVFTPISGKLPSFHIEEYYNRKNTHYINIGTNGFFLLGNTNPMGLSGIPRFADAAQAVYYARPQYKGNGTHMFVFEMQFHIMKANNSPFNIAPLDGKTVDIQIPRISDPFVVGALDKREEIVYTSV